MDLANGEVERKGKKKQADGEGVNQLSAAPDLSLKPIKTFIMTRRHRFNLIQVDAKLFISWNDSSDPSGAERRIEFHWPTCVV